MAPRLSSSSLSPPLVLGGGCCPVRAPVAQPSRLSKAHTKDDDDEDEDELCCLFPSSDRAEDATLRPENPMAKVLNDQQDALMYFK